MKLILVLTTLLAGVFLANSQTPSYVTVDSYPSSPYRITTSATFQTYSYWQDQSSSTWSFCGKGTSKTCSQRPSVNGVTPPYTASNIFWGKAASSSGVSGMGFNGITKTSPCTPSGCKGKGIIPGGSTPIDIAQLVHYNYPIYSDTGLDYFQIIVQVTIETPDSVQGPYPFTFSFFINETLNSYSRSSCKSPSNGCCYFLLSSSADPCADKIYLIETAGKKPTSDNSNTGVGIDVSQTKNFLINGVNYTFAVLGFKDSPDAKGNAKYFFISDEKGATASYLFASLVPACPSSASCSAAGTSLVLNQGDLTVTPPIAPSCTCQCANTTDVGKGYCLKTGLTTNGCSCACDSGYCLNNGTGAITGTGSSQTCSCNCANSKCPVGKVVDSSRCNCVCDTSYCVQTSYQTSDCSCSCPSTLCKTPYVADARCNCLCSLTAASCTGDRNVFNSSSCSCLCKSASSCSTTNNTNWIIDQTTCGCVCPASMATTCAQTHQVYNATSCSCGACLPNYVQDTTTNQLCGKCNLTAATCTAQGYTFNSESCSCQQCTTPAVCDINLGLVNDNSNPCICRNCTVGECKCGNGRIEPGETCDDGANSTLCCQKCLLQSTCIQDPCYLVGSCSLNSNKVSVCVQDALKCVNSECQNSTCSSNGTCIYTALDYKACGTETNLCNQWCFGGVCVNRITSNTQAICNASETCKINDCNPATGQCAITNVPDGTACDDGDVCTGSTANPDKCNNGNCVSGDANGPCFGVASLGPCYILSCDKSNGRCIRTVITNGSCDDENPCTVNDRCTPNGLCHGSLLSCSTPETVAPTYPKAGETSDWSNFCSTLGSNSTVCQSTDATTIKETAIDQLCSTQDSICSSLPVFCNFVKVQVCSLKAYLDASEPVCRFRKCDTNTTSSTKGQCIPASYLLEGSSCDDGDNCTVGDACSKTGVCSSGTQNICAVPIGGGGSDNTPIIATSIAAGGALIAAAAAGFLVKRLMDASGLADPFTWGDLNPSTSAQNPLYEPAVSAHDNPLFAANT